MSPSASEAHTHTVMDGDDIHAPCLGDIIILLWQDVYSYRKCTLCYDIVCTQLYSTEDFPEIIMASDYV